MATREIAARLETRRTLQETIGKGYRNSTLTQRLADADAENEQRERWLAMWQDAERKPAELYEFSRAADRRAAIADNRQRKMVQSGLADGSITVDRYLDYRLWQIEADLEHAPGDLVVDDVSFARFGKETAEGLEAAALARCNQTTGAFKHAADQLDELVAAARRHVAAIRNRRSV